MQTAYGTRGPAFEDLTARARIRDAALRHFAERGMEAATVRGIAAAAGVSPGLVQHHFGSKEGLRAACDAYVLQTIQREASQALDERRVGDPDFIRAAYATGPLLSRYMVRALVDGSPAGAALFDEIVRLTERYLASTAGAADSEVDRRAHAAVFVAMKLGLSVFQDQLVRVLQVRNLAQDGYPRIARAVLDIVSPRFVDPNFVAEARVGPDR
jgi:AcrR family transcriptional regulator